MPSGFEIDLSDLSDAERRLTRLAAAMLDLRPFWPKLVPLFIGWMRLQFETEGRFAADPWQRLSPRYAIWKQRHYPGKGLLVATGGLRRSASTPTRHVSQTTHELTINDPKVSWHGGAQRAPGMPRRRLLFDELPAIARNEVEQAAQEYVAEVLRRERLV